VTTADMGGTRNLQRGGGSGGIVSNEGSHTRHNLIITVDPDI